MWRNGVKWIWECPAQQHLLSHVVLLKCVVLSCSSLILLLWSRKRCVHCLKIAAFIGVDTLSYMNFSLLKCKESRSRSHSCSLPSCCTSQDFKSCIIPTFCLKISAVVFASWTYSSFINFWNKWVCHCLTFLSSLKSYSWLFLLNERIACGLPRTAHFCY